MGSYSKYSGLAVSYLVKGLVLSMALEIFYFGSIWLKKKMDKNHLNKSLKQKTPKEDSIYQVVFFPDPGYYCREFFNPNGCQDKKCRRIHEKTSFKTVLDFIEKAEQSVEICVYIFSSPDLAYSVINLYKKGIQVRLLTDAMQSEAAGDSQVGRIRAAGIPVGLHQSVFLMHHKFIIVDRKLIITGSLNWTRQAVLGNHENLLITNEIRLVQPYVDEFLKMWNSYFSPQQKRQLQTMP